MRANPKRWSKNDGGIDFKTAILYRLVQQYTKSRVLVHNDLNAQMELKMTYQDQANETQGILLKLKFFSNGKVQVNSRFPAQKQMSNLGINKV